MSTRKDAKLLDESTKHSYGAIPKQSVSTEPKRRIETKSPAFTASAPAVLEPSKDASRPPGRQNQRTTEDSSSPPINPWRTLVTCSCPQSSARVPVSTNGESNDRADEQPSIHEQTNGHLTTCSSFIEGYKNFATKLRKSKIIYVFQVLFFLIPVSGVIMGILFNKDCTESKLLPSFCGITGLIGTILIGLWMSLSYYHLRDQQSSFEFKFGFILLFSTFCLFTIIETCMLGMMSPSFDQYAPNYCNKTFYYCALYKQIATGIAAVFALMLYLPGSLHYLLCHCFSTPVNGIDQ